MSWYSVRKTADSEIGQSVRDLAATNLSELRGHLDQVESMIDNSRVEAWMLDKIATARNDLNDIRMHMSTELEQQKGQDDSN